MSRNSRELLYELLPAYLRFRDQTEPLDSPLRALMAVLERQYDALEGDIDRLYDDWFIETCQDWVAPLLGELIGVRGLEKEEAWVPTQRARIANSLSYRRAKGTLATLERVAQDVTGWPCLAVAANERLLTTQAAEHARPERAKLVDVRDTAALTRLGGPFDRTARNARVNGGRGLAPLSSNSEAVGPADVALYFWRLQSYPVRGRTARKISPGCYTFHPLGLEQPLFAAPSTSRGMTVRAGESDLPRPLDRKALAEELADRRKGLVPTTAYFGPRPAVEIIDPATGKAVPWQSIEIADLSRWQRPGARQGQRTVHPSRDKPILAKVIVALDPELGRFSFAEDRPAGGDVRVSYAFAQGGDLGGGPYVRQAASVDHTLPRPDASGAAAAAESSNERFARLQAAIAAWPSDEATAVLRIEDSATYGGFAGLGLEIHLAAGRTLVIEAAPGQSPTFIGDLLVHVEGGEEAAALVLDGLTLGGSVVLRGGASDPGDTPALELAIRHCTIQPFGDASGPSGSSAGVVADQGASYSVAARVESSCVTAIALPGRNSTLLLLDSVVDAAGASALASAGDNGSLACMIERCTLLGACSLAELRARDSIFAETLHVGVRNLGYIEHSYVAPGSSVPRLHGCQPDEADGNVTPHFSSRRLGQPGYAQLSQRCAPEIRTGASDGGEMGALAAQRNPFREANLAGILDEYLPWGLEPRIFHVT